MGSRYDAKNTTHVGKAFRFYVKKKQFFYAEANAEKQKAFLEKLATIDPARLRFVDETRIEDNAVNNWAYAPKGERAHCVKRAETKQAVSIIASAKINEQSPSVNDQLRAPLAFEGSCNRAIFETYLEEVLIPDLEPGEVVVLDNFSGHKGGIIEALIRAADCEILYASPYSPHLNPIEHLWSPMKYKLKQLLEYCTNDIYKALEIFFDKNQPESI